MMMERLPLLAGNQYTLPNTERESHDMKPGTHAIRIAALAVIVGLTVLAIAFYVILNGKH